MSDKTLAFKIDVQGVSNEEKELEKLGVQIKNLKNEMRELEKASKKGIASDDQLRQLAAYRKEIDKQTTEFKKLKQELYPVESSFSKLGNTIKNSFIELAKGGAVLAVAYSAFNKMKDAIMSTTAAIDIMNIASETTKQLFYDIAIQGQFSWQNIKMAVQAADEFNKLRLKQYDVDYNLGKIQREINALMLEATDITKEDSVRLALYTKVRELDTEQTRQETEAIKARLLTTYELLKVRQDDENLIKEMYTLGTQLEAAYAKSDQAMRRVESQMSGIEKRAIAEREAAHKRWMDEIEEWNKKNERLKEGTKEYAAMQDEIAKVIIAEAELAAQKKLTQQEIENTLKYKAPDGKLVNSEIEAIQATQDEKDRIWAEGMQKARENFLAQKKDAQDAANELTDIDLARIDQKQAIADAEIAITEGLADAVSQLTGKNKALSLAALAIEKSSAIARIIANISIANAKAIATSPLTLGQPWVSLNTGLGAISIARIVAETANSVGQISKYATGGRIQGGLQIHPDKSKDNTLIYVKQGETVLNESQVARLGGSGAMRKARVPGYAMGGYVGQQAPEIPASGFDYAALARLIPKQIILDTNKVRSSLNELEIITEPQRL